MDATGEWTNWQVADHVQTTVHVQGVLTGSPYTTCCFKAKLIVLNALLAGSMVGLLEDHQFWE